MCGADKARPLPGMVAVGSPPRVRSRPHVRPDRPGWRRITSACAEQTAMRRRPICAPRDHLRVCGADCSPPSCAPSCAGSPPRVRSRRSLVPVLWGTSWITSACAEQTAGLANKAVTHADHLRVCGADMALSALPSLNLGSPPRVRSRPATASASPWATGITSACAEQTVVFYCVLSQLNGVEYLIYALRRVS